MTVRIMRFTKLLLGLGLAVGDRVAALKLPGIGLDKEYRRYYPSGEMTARTWSASRALTTKGWKVSNWRFSGSFSATRAAGA